MTYSIHDDVRGTGGDVAYSFFAKLRRLQRLKNGNPGIQVKDNKATERHHSLSCRGSCGVRRETADFWGGVEAVVIVLVKEEKKRLDSLKDADVEEAK